MHADPATPDLDELVTEMSTRTDSGYLFGGLAASRGPTVQVADGVWRGGLSGVAFSAEVTLISRVTQGCQPVGPARHITAAERNLVVALDGAPALDCLLGDLGIESLADPRPALQSTWDAAAGRSTGGGRPRHAGPRTVAGAGH